MAQKLSFAAAVDEWTKQTEQRVEAVFKQSAVDLLNDAKARAPRVTGTLRNSLDVGINTPPPAMREGHLAAPVSDVAATIAGAEMGDTVSGYFTVNYAAFVEYGTSRMAPRGYVRLAAQNWQNIVSTNIQKAKTSTATTSWR